MPRPSRPPAASQAAPAAVARPGADRRLRLALAAVIGLAALASASPSNWLWGLNGFRHWSGPGPWLWTAALLVGLAPPLTRWFDRLLARAGGAWTRAQWPGTAIVIAVVTALVALLGDPIRFTGDHALRVGALGTAIPDQRLFPQAYPLDVLLNARLARALASLGIAPDLALRLVGAALAAAFAAAGVAFCRALGARGAVLVASVAVLLGGRVLTHFAGYDKYGPLMVGLALASLGVARLARHGTGLWPLAAGVVTCLLAHRVGYAVLPAAVLALGMAARAAGAGRLGIAAAATAIGATAAAMLPHTLHVLRTVDAAVHLPGGAVTRSLGGGGGLDAWMQVADGVNLLFFLVPLWPLGLVAWLDHRRSPAAGRRAGRFPVAPVAWVGIASQLAWLFTIRASRGSGRDWDAYLGAAVPVAFAIAGTLAAAWQQEAARRSLAATAWAALVLALAAWWLHADPGVALRRIETLMSAEPRWSDIARAHGHDHLGLWALNRGEFDRAARHFEAAVAVAPNPRYLHQAGMARLHGGELARAREWFTAAARLGPTVADPWVGLAAVSVREGRPVLARAQLDSALARDPGSAEALALRRTLGGP